jgi:tRNA (mo5U34)-methyltransferase
VTDSAPEGAREKPLHFEPLVRTFESFGYSRDPFESGARTAATQDPFTALLGDFYKHGDTPRWRRVIDQLPTLGASRYALDQPCVVIGDASEIDDAHRSVVRSALYALRPWRKGPFAVFGVHVDAEWRSDLKWSRVESALADCGVIASLRGQRVLDVGCGNGYYCLRALGAGATSVLGVDPSPLFVLQFELLRRLLPPLPAVVLPLCFEALPEHPRGFDTVFSMGVLYHRKSPLEHLERLVGCLAEGGQLVLETLVVEPSVGRVLEPRGRYANMSNVWSIPSVPELVHWLCKVGLTHARVASVELTTAAEQRATSWTSARSLGDGLDPTDSTRTLEGHPAPQRAVLVASR